MEGRVLEVPGDPDWTPEDRDYITAWLLEQTSRCPRCGTFAWEWQDEDGDRLHPWEGDLWRCFGCQELDEAQDKIRDSKTGTHGLQARLFKVESD